MKPQSDSYMWLYRTDGDTDKPVVLYGYQPGCGVKHFKEFLKEYKGYLHTDGYAGYHDLGEDIAVVGCWAHARRKFDEAVKSLPKGKVNGSSASQGLACCNLKNIPILVGGRYPENRLQQARIKAGVTQDRIAEVLSCDPRTIQRYEAGTLSPSQHTLSVMQKYYGCRFADLFPEKPL